MLRLRKRNGEVENLTDSTAVEFVDFSGKLAVVVTQVAGGAVNILTPGDPIFNAYARINSMRVSKVSVHEPFEGRKVTL
jgi:hypothetical protein